MADSGLPEGHLSAERLARYRAWAAAAVDKPPMNTGALVNGLLDDIEADRRLWAAELDRRAATIAEMQSDSITDAETITALRSTIAGLEAERDRAIAAMNAALMDGDRWQAEAASAAARVAADTPKLQAARRVVDAWRVTLSRPLGFEVGVSELQRAQEALAAAFTEEPAGPATGVRSDEQVGRPGGDAMSDALPVTLSRGDAEWWASRDPGWVRSERQVRLIEACIKALAAGEPAAPPEPEPTFQVTPDGSVVEWPAPPATPDAER